MRGEFEVANDLSEYAEPFLDDGTRQWVDEALDVGEEHVAVESILKAAVVGGFVIPRPLLNDVAAVWLAHTQRTTVAAELRPLVEALRDQNRGVNHPR
ncbi:hypothetical protein [Rhodococcus tibetensis]|uniref:Uncharacterized protein n=1 Tax=Rhodococcus tibetensis TaxID=2965064 RepID=A0ABT1Q8Z5_9NOCA|nr:hypothetical protein [Rhodococcus sp. FXJ9.536]MCQ4118717.1 hypothetical protein [Rhodococcus sp. FXJ9.536]